MNYEKLSRQALKCMYVATAAGSILTLAILGAVNYFIFFPKDLDIAKSASLAAALLILINMLVSPYFRYHRYRYRIDKECIDIHEATCLPNETLCLSNGSTSCRPQKVP